MESRVPEFRKQVGFALRLVVVLVLGALWVAYIWWWLAGVGLLVSIAILILHPFVYPVLYVLVWIDLAFNNRPGPVLPGYWDNYPDRYFNWCWRCLRFGFPTLRRWLLEGFH